MKCDSIQPISIKSNRQIVNDEQAIMAHQSHANNELIDPLPDFEIDLQGLSFNRGRFTIEQFLAALPVTMTLNRLTINLHDYEPTFENNERFIEPLCHCIANVRRHTEHHPLHTLEISWLDIRQNFGELHVLEQFLVAAKQCGIRDLLLVGVSFLPIQCVVEFFRDNVNIKTLSMHYVSVADGGAAMSLPLMDQPPICSSVFPTLERLSLAHIKLESSLAATNFSIFLAHMKNNSALDLGCLFGTEHGRGRQLTARTVSKIQMPSVKQLAVCSLCRIEHLKAALEAATNTVVELNVAINYDKDDATEKLDVLVSMIRRAVKLNRLQLSGHGKPRIRLPPQIFHAIEACATITEFVSVPRAFWSQDRVQQLQGYAFRNRKLACFAANPSNYPVDKLLDLMCNLANCPSGLYMLARCLPQVFSFQKGDSLFPPTESIPKRNLRKRRKISYKE